MATVPTVGGGNKGEQLVITLTPDSTFKSEIDALITAKTKVVGKLIQLATGANYSCTSPGNGEFAHGRILDYEKTSTSYRLTCEVWGFTDGSSAFKAATRIVNLEYSGSPSRGNGGLVYGTAYRPIYGNASGIGFIIGIDVPDSGRLDMLI